jgi:hypothetical protein
VANRNYASGGKIYSMHTMPVLIDCNFVVDDSNAIGITSLKGPTVAVVNMHSVAATPSGLNPAAGTIIVQLQDNYNLLYSMQSSIHSPLSGSSLLVASAGLTVGVAYAITILGTTSVAQWHALGVPAGVTPAVGVSFIALATSATGTGAVQTSATAGSGVATIELLKPSLTLAPNRLLQPATGAQFILQCRDYAGAIVAPAAGSKISVQFYLSNSSVIVQGE